MREPTKNEIRRAAAVMGRLGGKVGGKSRSEAKRKAAGKNGRLGGRPRKPWKQLTAAGKFARKRRARKGTPTRG